MNQTILLTDKEAEFLEAYIEAIYFTETGDDTQPSDHSVIDPNFLRESTIDCLAFYNRVACFLSEDQVRPAAHDFWFTRNLHGVGFWETDRYWDEHQQKKFTELSRYFGPADAYFVEEDR